MTSAANSSLDVLLERGRPNSFGFLRFMLAALVVLAHAYPIGGLGVDPLARVGADTLGGVAVNSFFILSGFLIAHSFVQSKSVWRYLWHRFLRIFPGFWVCLAVVAFGFGPLFYYLDLSRHSVAGYFAIDPQGPLSFLRANALLMMRQLRIGAILATNPYSGVLNGSLWSLEYEFRCYVFVAAFGVLGLFSARRQLGRAILLVAFVAMAIANVVGLTSPLLRRLWWGGDTMTWLCMWFVAGVLAHSFRKRIPLDGRLFVVALTATLACLLLPKTLLYRCISPVPFAYSLFWLAARLPLAWWDKRGDFSYGLYIYAFPVQQLMATLGVQRYGVFAFTTTSLVGATLLGIASFHLVEKRALAWKDLGAGKRQPAATRA